MNRRILATALALCLLASLPFSFALPATAQKEAIDVTSLFSAEIYTDGDATLPYRIYLPEDYDPAYTYPLIFFFHGAGERGNDNAKQLKNAIGQMFSSPDSPVYGCIVVAPQCPAGKQWVNVPSWQESQYSTDEIAESEELKLVLKLLDELKGTYSIDGDCVYATGLSMGGYATWDLLVRHTDLFAAGIPVCGGADYRYAQKLKDVPIYTFHGLQDPTVPYRGTEKMVSEIRASGGEEIVYVTYPEGNHFIWEDAFSTEGLYDWLLTKRLSDRSKAETETETETDTETVIVPETETVPEVATEAETESEMLTEENTETAIEEGTVTEEETLTETDTELETPTEASPDTESAEETVEPETETETESETESESESETETEETPQAPETEAVAPDETDNTLAPSDSESLSPTLPKPDATEEAPTEAATEESPAKDPAPSFPSIALIVGASAVAVVIPVALIVLFKRKK